MIFIQIGIQRPTKGSSSTFTTTTTRKDKPWVIWKTTKQTILDLEYWKYLTEQNNLRAVQVVANQTVVQAQAQARSNVARATGESQAIKIITEQLRQSPQYLQWQSINRWNGQMPYSLGSGGAFPFFQLPLQQQQSSLPQQNQTNR
jgi:hypothetical protein